MTSGAGWAQLRQQIRTLESQVGAALLRAGKAPRRLNTKTERSPDRGIIPHIFPVCFDSKPPSQAVRRRKEKRGGYRRTATKGRLQDRPEGAFFPWIKIVTVDIARCTGVSTLATPRLGKCTEHFDSQAKQSHASSRTPQRAPSGTTTTEIFHLRSARSTTPAGQCSV